MKIIPEQVISGMRIHNVYHHPTFYYESLLCLFGFIVLIAICISLTSIVSEQKNKITSLTQEMGIIKNKVKEIENEKNNKKK